MLAAIQELLVLFMILGIGYLFGKVKLVDEVMTERLSKLILSGTFPMLIVASMDRPFDQQLWSRSIWLLVATIIICLMIIAVIEMLVRKMGKTSEQDVVCQFVMLFGNTTFMGMPVLKAMLGEEGVFYTAVVCMVFNSLMFSYGLIILSRKRKPDIKKLLFNPGLIATIIGLCMFLLPVSLPYIFHRSLSWCGDMTIPLSLFVGGSIISRNPIREMIQPIRVWTISLLRIAVYPLLIIGILTPIGVEHRIVCVLAIIFATPAPMTAGSFTQGYGGDTFFAGKLVVVSNLLSIITMSGLVWFFTSGLY